MLLWYQQTDTETWNSVRQGSSDEAQCALMDSARLLFETWEGLCCFRDSCRTEMGRTYQLWSQRNDGVSETLNEQRTKLEKYKNKTWNIHEWIFSRFPYRIKCKHINTRIKGTPLQLQYLSLPVSWRERHLKFVLININYLYCRKGKHSVCLTPSLSRLWYWDLLSDTGKSSTVESSDQYLIFIPEERISYDNYSRSGSEVLWDFCRSFWDIF